MFYNERMNILLLLLFWNETFAVSGTEPLICPRPREISLPLLSEEQQTLCREHRNTELLASQEMREEVQEFEALVLGRMYRDNGSDPNALAELAILTLRQHDHCLREICREAFAKCGPTQLSSAQTSAQNEWCREKVTKLSQATQTKLVAIATENLARKERSLIQQKWEGISSRFRQQFQPWMSATVRDMKIFMEKVYNFIRDPA